MASEKRILIEKTAATADELQEHFDFLKEAYPDHHVVFSLTPGGHAHWEVWRPGFGPMEETGDSTPTRGREVEHYLNRRSRQNDNVNMGVNGAS